MKDPLEEAGVDVDRGVATKVLLLVIAALVAVFVVEPSSRTPLLIVVGVILLVMFHEAGHYFTAKRSGMKVTEFFLGFGPRLWSFRRGETEYGVKAIPAGGYVRIVGMSNLEEIDPADESRTFRSGRTRNRLIVILAGVTVNAVLAFLLFFVAVAGEGRVATGDASTTVSRVEAGTAARAAGFRPGDRIVAIDGDPVRGWTALRRGILSHGGESTTFTVVRKGTTVDLTATPELQDGRGFLGIAPSVAYRSVGALEAVPETFRVMGTTVTGTFEGIGRVFSPSGLSSIADNFTSHAPKEGSRADLERPRSLVGIVDQGSAIVGDDVWTLLRLLGVLSMLFAVFNLLPLLPFDGGHAVVVVYEAIASKIRGRTVRVDFRKLTPVMATTILILALVAVPTMLLDLRDASRAGDLVIERRVTRRIHVGEVAVGGGAPVSVQSMTTTKTADVDGTLAQIYSLAAAGCDIVRCTCNEEEAAEGLARIVPRSPVPLVADIHFQHKLALAAMEAGVQALRLNPGNIRKPEHIKVVAREAKDRGLPIRIGVNAGSLDPDIAAAHGGATPEALVASAQRELAYFGEVGFDDVKISVKSSNVATMIDAYRLLADTVDAPLHLGVTEAGPLPGGLVKSTAGIATLLAEGIGDTIRFSLTADPVEEAKAGRQLLEALGLRERKGLDLIACPSCGRAEVDVIKVASDAQAALEARKIPLQVAVMGCVVNGPGEARDADLGIAAGRGKGHLFVRGQVVRVVPEAEMVSALVEEAERIVAEGIEARLAAADVDAEAITAAAREELLQIQGVDVNDSESKIAKIREIAE